MTIAILLCIIAILLSFNFYLWRTGSLQKAQNPEAVLDKPVMDPKERRAIKKRLHRWKEEGKLSREEYETFYGLCQAEWD